MVTKLVTGVRMSSALCRPPAGTWGRYMLPVQRMRQCRSRLTQDDERAAVVSNLQRDCSSAHFVVRSRRPKCRRPCTVGSCGLPVFRSPGSVQSMFRHSNPPPSSSFPPHPPPLLLPPPVLHQLQRKSVGSFPRQAPAAATSKRTNSRR